MYSVIIALVPTLLVSLFFFGIGAAIVTVTSILSCVFFEWSISKYILHRQKNSITDGSAILTGLLLAFNLPSNLPVWIVIIGSLVAIGVGKMTFGGLGCNPFNPALVGRVFLLVSFPVQMTTWPRPLQWWSYTDAVTGATPLSLMKMAVKSGDPTILDKLPDSLSMFLGVMNGSLGEVCSITLLIGCIYLIAKKVITWHIPVSILGTVAIFSCIMHWVNPIYASPLAELFSGGLILGSCYMATDYVTSPMSYKGQIIYGCFIGFLTIVIRTFGSYPEGMSFAILIMNAFTPLINNYCKPKKFGEVVAQ
jgi:electron transport complex protein RnfD